MSETKYHMTDEGVRVCEAQSEESCPVKFTYGDLRAVHYDTLEEANAGFAEEMESEHGPSGLSLVLTSLEETYEPEAVDTEAKTDASGMMRDGEWIWPEERVERALATWSLTEEDARKLIEKLDHPIDIHTIASNISLSRESVMSLTKRMRESRYAWRGLIFKENMEIISNRGGDMLKPSDNQLGVLYACKCVTSSMPDLSVPHQPCQRSIDQNRDKRDSMYEELKGLALPIKSYAPNEGKPYVVKSGYEDAVRPAEALTVGAVMRNGNYAIGTKTFYITQDKERSDYVVKMTDTVTECIDFDRPEETRVNGSKVTHFLSRFSDLESAEASQEFFTKNHAITGSKSAAVHELIVNYVAVEGSDRSSNLR